jgi:hypothetical protein
MAAIDKTNTLNQHDRASAAVADTPRTEQRYLHSSPMDISFLKTVNALTYQQMRSWSLHVSACQFSDCGIDAPRHLFTTLEP